jgi:hypothetical protein
MDNEEIRHELVPAYIPKQNGVSEWYNRTETESSHYSLERYT